jgi:hypothetical protein
MFPRALYQATGIPFVKACSSFIVNLDRIETIERFRIVFGNIYIPVSDQYKEPFQKFLDENFL